MAELRSDPWGTILPVEKAREAWYQLGTRLAVVMRARLIAYDPDFVFQADGWSNTWHISTGAACALAESLEAFVGSSL